MLSTRIKYSQYVHTIFLEYQYWLKMLLDTCSTVQLVDIGTYKHYTATICE